MSSREKWVAAFLGVLVFVGLWFFIWTSLGTPSLPAEEDLFEDYEDDFDIETGTGTLNDLFSVEPTTATPLNRSPK